MDETPRTKRGTPRRRMSGAKRRESILEAAATAFAERGYDSVRTLDVAERAGISEALIFRHFDTKRDLYCEAMRRSSEALESQVAEATTADGEVSDRLERGLDAFLAFVADRSSAWQLLTQDVSDPKITRSQRALRRRAIGALAEMLALDPRATRSNLDRGQLEQLAEIIAGGAEALAGWWAHNPKVKRSELVSLLMTFVWEGLGRTLESAPPATAREPRAKSA